MNEEDPFFFLYSNVVPKLVHGSCGTAESSLVSSFDKGQFHILWHFFLFAALLTLGIAASQAGVSAEQTVPSRSGNAHVSLCTPWAPSHFPSRRASTSDRSQ